jgi:hypothetical protein
MCTVPNVLFIDATLNEKPELPANRALAVHNDRSTADATLTTLAFLSFLVADAISAGVHGGLSEEFVAATKLICAAFATFCGIMAFVMTNHVRQNREERYLATQTVDVTALSRATQLCNISSLVVLFFWALTDILQETLGVMPERGVLTTGSLVLFGVTSLVHLRFEYVVHRERNAVFDR